MLVTSQAATVGALAPWPMHIPQGTGPNVGRQMWLVPSAPRCGVLASHGLSVAEHFVQWRSLMAQCYSDACEAQEKQLLKEISESKSD